MQEPRANRYQSQGLSLHYASWGDKDAPPLLLLHGGRDHCRNWDWLANKLLDRYHIIAPDLRGHGDSDHVTGGGYTMSAWVYDVASLLDHLGAAQVQIIGHSLGGNIALRYAGIYPERVHKLVSIEGLGPSPQHQAERAAIPIATRMADWIDQTHRRQSRQPRLYASMEEASARMAQEFAHLALQITDHLTRHGVRQTPQGFQWKFDPALYVMLPDDIARADIHALWQNIHCPTLLVYGDDSWASNPQKDGRAQHFKNARVLSVAGAGHWVHHDRFDIFHAAVEEFLSEA